MTRAVLLAAGLVQLTTGFVAPTAAPRAVSQPQFDVEEAAPFGRMGVVLHAVPKKRTSKMKTRSRKANWLAKARLQRMRALTLGRSILKKSSTSFVYNPDAADDEAVEDDDEAAEEETGEVEA
eukprot:CAMPEP_0184100186 /NCGR_PEP_ID=MMETSP0974-20121125/12205_1 /TAXON_ID=483370 /ORGANISM="non described non described, Strain CCMP2097" /LENGTH=122 /DNA_ID=CAMNT_0026403111 /DNA_START=46 /DNA_END=414 /DNA_ORIENTATION=-